MSPLNDLILTNGRLSEPESYWSESEDGYSCKVNMAGIKKENIKILIEQGLLKVSAEQDGHKYSSVISAPKKADPKKSSARYEDGMLYLELKKLDSHKSVELTITE